MSWFAWATRPSSYRRSMKAPRPHDVPLPAPAIPYKQEPAACPARQWPSDAGQNDPMPAWRDNLEALLLVQRVLFGGPDFSDVRGSRELACPLSPRVLSPHQAPGPGSGTGANARSRPRQTRHLVCSPMKVVGAACLATLKPSQKSTSSTRPQTRDTALCAAEAGLSAVVGPGITGVFSSID